jgi:DNA processing protein
VLEVEQLAMPQPTLQLGPLTPAASISPMREMGAYEALWLQPDATFKRLADKFREHEGALPSEFISSGDANKTAAQVLDRLRDHGVKHFGVRIHGAGDYPQKLRDAAHPVELLYFQGIWDLVETPCVAVVGTRNPSNEGIKRTKQLVRELVKSDWTIVSGLAAGIDTVAHKSAIEFGGRTVAVIGTPISEVYPRENTELQSQLARNFLVVSQVPVERYSAQGPRVNRGFFPERNVTMSALTAATIIVEASNTSGTLIQARAALKQGRKLFILDSCFRNPELKWPAKFAEKGAVRVESFEQIREALAPSN